MPSPKYSSLQLLGILLLSVLIPMATVVSLTRAQEKPNTFKPASSDDAEPCTAPKSEFDGWLRMRSLPVRFTEIDGNTVYWKFEERGDIHLGSFVLMKNTKFFDEQLKEKDKAYFESNLKSEFGVNFDSQCFLLFSATKIKS